MRYLIDGYNLLHALGMSPQGIGLSLERSRLRLIDWLTRELGERCADVCLIFDSSSARGQAEQNHRGLAIRYSSGQTADDLIEEMIRKERMPSQLSIVSNDSRLQQAGKRGGCVVLTCAGFVDWLQAPDPKAKTPSRVPEEKPSGLSQDELDEWLNHFGEGR